MLDVIGYFPTRTTTSELNRRSFRAAASNRSNSHWHPCVTLTQLPWRFRRKQMRTRCLGGPIDATCLSSSGPDSVELTVTGGRPHLGQITFLEIGFDQACRSPTIDSMATAVNSPSGRPAAGRTGDSAAGWRANCRVLESRRAFPLQQAPRRRAGWFPRCAIAAEASLDFGGRDQPRSPPWLLS